MVEIRQSKCTCGKCGAQFLINWELEMLDSLPDDTDSGIYYQSDGEMICPMCGNCVSARLMAQEEPIGILKSSNLIFVNDSWGTGKTNVEIPKIYFYDR